MQDMYRYSWSSLVFPMCYHVLPCVTMSFMGRHGKTWEDMEGQSQKTIDSGGKKDDLRSIHRPEKPHTPPHKSTHRDPRVPIAPIYRMGGSSRNVQNSISRVCKFSTDRDTGISSLIPIQIGTLHMRKFASLVINRPTPCNHAYSSTAPLVSGETQPTTPLVAGPPTAPAVTAEGASCAVRAVPSDRV